MDTLEDLPSTRDPTAETIIIRDITRIAESKIGIGEEYRQIKTDPRAGNINTGIVNMIETMTAVNHHVIHPTASDTRGNNEIMNEHALSVQAFIQKIGL